LWKLLKLLSEDLAQDRIESVKLKRTQKEKDNKKFGNEREESI
jgi:hypothetical protein